MHSKLFPDAAEPPIAIEEFEHYLYWNNRGWGTQTETVEMVVSVGQRVGCGHGRPWPDKDWWGLFWQTWHQTETGHPATHPQGMFTSTPLTTAGRAVP